MTTLFNSATAEESADPATSRRLRAASTIEKHTRGNPLQLTIEKLVYGGDGLARLPEKTTEGARGKAVFIPFVLEGEQVEAGITEEKPGFCRARLEALVAASAERVKPPCPYFFRCGGCQYQHSSYEHQLRIKRTILLETLSRIAQLDWKAPIQIHASPPWNYRNRSRMRVHQAPGSVGTHGSPNFAMGYYEFGSHRLLSVEACPISSPLINAAIAGVWRMGHAGRIPRQVSEIEFVADGEDRSLLLQVYLAATQVQESIARELAEEVSEAVPEILGVAFFGMQKSGVSDEEDVEPGYGAGTASRIRLGVAGQDYLIHKILDTEYRVSVGSFFQVNRHLVTDLVRTITAGAGGKWALDFYAGAGLFSVPLAKNFQTVVAVETAAESFSDLRHNAPQNVQAFHGTTGKWLSQRASSKAAERGAPDLIVVDPPRAGLGKKVARQIADLAAPLVSYIGCDPATLSRDLKVLLESGYGVEEIHLFDFFPQTAHIESVLQLKQKE